METDFEVPSDELEVDFEVPENEIEEKPFFGLGDTAGGIWDAVAGLKETAPSAYHRLAEGLVRPDLMSDAAKQAFREEKEYIRGLEEKTLANRIAGTSTSTGETFREVTPSLGFSLTALGSGILGRLGGAAAGSRLGAPGAVAGFLGAGGAAGAASYRMAGSQFLYDAFEALDEQSQAKNGRPMTEEEKAAAYDALLPVAENTAAWEAGPEAISNAVMVGLGPLALNIGKKSFESMAKTALGRSGLRLGSAATVLGSEYATETATELGQGADRAKLEAYKQGKPMEESVSPYAGEGGALKAFKKIAPVTTAQTALLGGAAKTIDLAAGGAKRLFAKEQADAAAQSAEQAGMPEAASAMRQIATQPIARESVFAPRESLQVPEVTAPPATEEDKAARSQTPIVFTGNVSDTFFRNGQWVDEAGTPVADTAALEAERQKYIETGELPEGMQVEEVAPVEEAPFVAPEEEVTVEAPVQIVEEVPVEQPATPPTISEAPVSVQAPPTESPAAPTNDAEALQTREFSRDEFKAMERIGEGSESEVFRQGDKVYKVGEPYNAEETLGPRVRETLRGNNLAGRGDLRYAGFYRGKNGIINPVFEQAYVEGRKATPDEIKAHMESKGWTQRPNGTFQISTPEGTLVTTPDLIENVLVTESGEVAPIDVSAYLEPETQQTDAISQPSATKILPREQGETREEGSQRVGVGREQQGQETPEESQAQEESVAEVAPVQPEESTPLSVRRWNEAPENTLYTDQPGRIGKNVEVEGQKYSLTVKEEAPNFYEVHFGGFGSLEPTNQGAFKIARNLLPHIEEMVNHVASKNPQAKFRIAANTQQKLRVFRRFLQRAGYPIDGTGNFFSAPHRPLFSDIRYSRQRDQYITPEQDAAYLTAVERGDMDTAQRMVDEAAKALESATPRVTGEDIRGKYVEIIKNANSRERKSLESDGMVGFILVPSSGNVYYFNRMYALHGEILKQIGVSSKDAVSGLLYKDGVLITDKTGESFSGNPKTVEIIYRKFGFDGGSQFYFDDSISGHWSKRPSRTTVADPVTRDAEGNVIPLSQRFNPETGDIRYSRQRRRRVATGVTPQNIESAKTGLAKLLPNIATAWTGTRAQINKFLREDKDFKPAYKERWKALNPEKSDAQFEESYDAWIEGGLNGQEGFTFNGRTYVISDQVAVYEGENPAEAARRVLIHEDAHEGLAFMRHQNPQVEEKWKKLRAEIPAEELDDLAIRYPWLSGWRDNEAIWDALSDEWISAKMEQIETRGQPAPDSLLGRIIQWLKDAWKSFFKTEVDPTDQAILDFMDASREGRFRERAEAARRGVSYSASDPTGGADMTPRRYFDVTGVGQDVVARPPQNLRSKSREDTYGKGGFVSSLPEYMKNFTEFLGEPTANSRIRQSFPIMVQFARSILGGIHGHIPEINAENTERAKQEARNMLSRDSNATRLKEEFQNGFAPTDPETGQVLHAGDAAAAVVQLELHDYATRLAAKTGDLSLLAMLEPYVNDVILGDYLTMSGAGRLLQARSMVNKDNGYFTAIQLSNGAMHESAEEEAGGKENLQKVVESRKSDEVDKVVDEEMAPIVAETEQEAERVAREYEEEGWLERMWPIIVSEEQALTAEFERAWKQYDMLLHIQQEMEAVAGSQAQPSMAEDYGTLRAKFASDPAGLKKALEESKQKALELFRKLATQPTSADSKDTRKKRTMAFPLARKTFSADAQAKKLLESYEGKNRRVKREKPAWRKTFEDQVRNPKSPEEFMKEMEGHGIAPETSRKMLDVANKIANERASRLADKALEAKEGRDKSKKSDGKRINPKSFLGSVVKAIMNAPLARQKILRAAPETDAAYWDRSTSNQEGYGSNWNPEFVEETFTKALMDQGVPEARARDMAKRMTGRMGEIMQAAQAKAAEKAAKGLGMKEATVRRIEQAIRSQALNPSNVNPVVQALAEQAGFRPLSQEDFQRLAQLDEQAQLGSRTLAAQAYAEMQRILARVSPAKGWLKVLEQVFVNGALSSLSVMNLNWTHPPYILVRRLLTDLLGITYDGISGKNKNLEANLGLLGETFTSLWESRRNFANQAKFSLKNDAYQNRVQELLNSEHSLYDKLMEALEQAKKFKTDPKTALWGMTKLPWLSSDWVRRILATADQTWGSTIQNYVMRNEALRMMVQKAGLTVEQAAHLVNQAKNIGDAEQTRQATMGQPPEVAALVGQDAFRAAVQKAVADAVRAVDPTAPDAGVEIEGTMDRENLMELGNRRSEDSPWWDIPNTLLEGVKHATSTFRNKVPLLGRPVTGFISVGANLLNRSFYLTPLGFLRVAAKLKHGQRAGFYKETMGTEAQVRMRLHEAITSTVVLAILAALRLWKDDDQEGLVVTGMGPESKGIREAWLKQGHKPGHIELRNSKGEVMASFPYTRGGFDHMAVALTSFGAMDDLELDGHTIDEDGLRFGWSYLQTWASNQARQAQFFALKALVGAAPRSDKPEAFSAWLGYSANPFTPWGGLTKSSAKLFSGQQDESSMPSAVLSQLPVLQPIFGVPEPKRNYLGDQVGGHPREGWKMVSERLAYAGLPFFIGLDPEPADVDLYEFITRNGIAPSMPLRSELETRNGWIPDSSWASYLEIRGQYLKQELRRNMRRMEAMQPEDRESEMSTISRDATLFAKKRMGLK